MSGLIEDWSSVLYKSGLRSYRRLGFTLCLKADSERLQLVDKLWTDYVDKLWISRLYYVQSALFIWVLSFLQTKVIK